MVSSDGRHRNLRDALHRFDPASPFFLGFRQAGSLMKEATGKVFY
jgi:hypothetical protein